jgi:hypothetical protein
MPLLHSCDEAGLTFEHTGNSVFHQLFGVLAIGRGNLLEPRFNVGREMYFHAFQDTGKPADGQCRDTVRRTFMAREPRPSATAGFNSLSNSCFDPAWSTTA